MRNNVNIASSNTANTMLTIFTNYNILKSQKLDITFIVRYILNPKYQLTDIDEYLNFDTVILYQKHIDKNKLIEEFNKYTSDDDSVEDFETVSKKN